MQDNLLYSNYPCSINVIEENRVSKLQIRALGLFTAGTLKSGSTRKLFRSVKRKIRRKLKNDRKKAVMLKAG